MCAPCAAKLRNMPVVRGMSGDGASGESVIDRYYRGKDVRAESVVPGLFECVYRWATAVVVDETPANAQDATVAVVAGVASGRRSMSVGGAAMAPVPVPARCSSVPVAGAPFQRDEGYFGMTDDEMMGGGSKPTTPRGSLLDALDLGLTTVPDADMALLTAIGLTPKSLVLAGPLDAHHVPRALQMLAASADAAKPSKRNRPKRQDLETSSATSDELAQSLAPSICAAATSVLGGPLVAPDFACPAPRRAPAPLVFPQVRRLLPVTHQVYPTPDLVSVTVSPELIGQDEQDEIWHVGAPMAFSGGAEEQSVCEFQSSRETKQLLPKDRACVKATIRGGVRKYRRQRAHWTDALASLTVAKALVVGLAEQTGDAGGSTSSTVKSVNRAGQLHVTTTVAPRVEQTSKPVRKKRKDAGIKRGPMKKPDLTIKVLPFTDAVHFDASTTLPTPLSPASIFVRAQSILSASSASTSTSASRASTPLLSSMPADPQDTIWTRLTKGGKRWCLVCGTTYTTQWREGPWGKQTVCNRHGLALKGKPNADSAPRLDLSPWAHERKEDRTAPLFHQVCFTCHKEEVPHAAAQLKGDLLRCGGCGLAVHCASDQCMKLVPEQQFAHVKSPGSNRDEASDPVWFCTNACVDAYWKCMRGETPVIDDSFLKRNVKNNPQTHQLLTGPPVTTVTPPTVPETAVMTLPVNAPTPRKRRRNATESDSDYY
ncbi:hypothetical protein BCR44DRAFT_250962 [Catenaria anguillulae PL171]|uniref:GATA-type domain-containing protein n=1 Tax=Catenaria anguillulae PL171 TaxID=765915 RepID=A0A1Y2I2Q2_9FUNG|nr:hypothetical protein BCR44DRAFT_250962 [Catenaria anguillulae PL171]